MLKHVLFSTCALAALATAPCTQAQPTQSAPAASAEAIRQADAASEAEWYYSVGVQNYVFALPLTIFERERKLRLDPAAVEKAKKFAPAAPINEIGHMKTLATADDIMPYTPNNDTVYSGALLELTDEPIILTAPDIADRYWSVEVADAYTNNLFYIGTRATGGNGGNHAFVGPNWKGTLPAGVIEQRVPTNGMMFAIRIGVLPQDAAGSGEGQCAAGAIQPTSLKNWGDNSKLGQAAVPKLEKRPDYKGDLAFFQTAADLLAENPPPKDHQAAIILLGRGGIDVGSRSTPPSLTKRPQRGLVRGPRMGPQIMKWKVKFRGTPYPTRWNNLRPGTYGFDYFDRAAGALEGLFVHDREEAEYFSTYEDGDAHLLDGANQYVVHFNKDEIPPTLQQRLLVVHDVRRRLPVGEESDQPLFDRRPDQGADLQSGWVAGRLYPEPAARRPREQLASLPAERSLSDQLPDLSADGGRAGSRDARQVSSAHQVCQLISSKPRRTSAFKRRAGEVHCGVRRRPLSTQSGRSLIWVYPSGTSA